MNSSANRGLILLVEDDENDAFFFQRAFQKTGFRNAVEVARDGLEAMQYLAGESIYGDRMRYPEPTLMVLDLNTPRRQGIEVLRWVRTRPELRRLVVVVLTSSNSDVDLDATYSLGVNSYLLKPADPTQFVETIQMLASYWIGLNRVPVQPPTNAPSRSAVPA